MKRVFFPILIAVSLTAMSSTAVASGLTVAAAANLKSALDEIETAFEAETSQPVNVIYGASGRLATQIQAGAPFDVFLSANTEYPGDLQKKGLTLSEPFVYAKGALVLWTTTGLDLSAGLKVLASPAVKKIAAPNPKTAPYGREAVRALSRLGLEQEVSSKLVLGESVAQAAQFVESGAADVGFAAKSVVATRTANDRVRWFDVPRDAYEPIAQAVVILKRAAGGNEATARAFVKFLSSETCRKIFEKNGYEQ